MKIPYLKYIAPTSLFILFLFLNKSPQDKKTQNILKKEITWQTAPIELATSLSSIKIPAKVKSNQFAIISPRRNGIIQDILVDIGDVVTEGQTIGFMFPEGVEGKSSAAIAEASSRLQKARSKLAQAKGVATQSVLVATKQWQETTLQNGTQSTLVKESQKQLIEKKSEAILISTQTWEKLKLILFGTGTNRGSRTIQGQFSDSIQETKVENLANEIQKMESSGRWNNDALIVEHLLHLDEFLIEVELLYKNVQVNRELSMDQITSNLSTIQSQQIKISQLKQSVLLLEEKYNKLLSQQSEKEAGVDRSLKMIGLVSSQQDLSITQAEKDIEVALARYNSVLIKDGNRVIISPFSGIITSRMVDVGQSVTMNSTLFYLEGVDSNLSKENIFEIHFDIPESWRNKVSVGDKIALKTVDTGELIDGKIFRMSEQLNLDTHGIPSTAILNAPADKGDLEGGVLHGQSVFVYLESSQSSFFTIPSLALKKRGSDYFIWKKNPPQSPLIRWEEDIDQIQVKLIAEDGEFSQIFSREILEHDLIITAPSFSLFKKSDE